MQAALIVGAFLVAAGAIGWLVVIPLYRQWQRYVQLYETLEAVDANPWYRFVMSIKGMRSRMWNVLLVVLPALVTVLDWIVSAPLLPIIPAKYQQHWPLLISFIGLVNFYLRSITTTPEGSPVPPAVVDLKVPTPPTQPDIEVTMAGPTVLAVAPATAAVPSGG